MSDRHERGTAGSCWRGALAAVFVLAAGLLLPAGAAQAAAPGPVIHLNFPSGPFPGPSANTSYHWGAVGGASWYQVYVSDGSITWSAWYTAAAVGCAGDATCDLSSPDTGLTTSPNDISWWVRTWNSDGYGPWSVGRSYYYGHSGYPRIMTDPDFPLSVHYDHPPDFQWPGVPQSSWYELYVIKYDPVLEHSTVYRRWFSEGELGCPNAFGDCRVDDFPIGGYSQNMRLTWWVRTWNGSGYGQWSAPYVSTLFLIQ